MNKTPVNARGPATIQPYARAVLLPRSIIFSCLWLVKHVKIFVDIALKICIPITI
jgi:hypothetical protein